MGGGVPQLSEAFVYAGADFRPRGRSGRRRGLAAGAALMLVLAAGGCKSSVEKARAYDALYDQMMVNKAYPAAMHTIAQATVLDDNDPVRWIKLGAVQNILDRPAQAMISYQRALDLAPDNLDALENLAILAVRAKDYSSAKRFVEPLLLLSPNNPNGMLASGAIAVGERRFPDAEAIAAQIIAAAPERTEGYALRLVILRAQDKPKEAIALIEQRLAVNPTDQELLLQALDLYRGQGDFAGVRRTAVRLAPLFPNDPRYAMESARAFHAEGREADARKILQDLSTRYRTNGPLMASIARYWRETNPPAFALDQIRTLAKAGGPAVKAALGDVLIDMGDVPTVLTMLRPLAGDKVTARNVDPQTVYARALLASGQAGPAEIKVAAILDYDATNVAALVLRARIGFARHDLAPALNDAQLALTGDQGNEQAALLVAQIYLAMGNAPLAQKAFGDARQAFPDSMGVVRQWTDSLLARHDLPQATAISADFARRHIRYDAAWQLYGRLCTATGDPLCAIEIRARRVG